MNPLKYTGIFIAFTQFGYKLPFRSRNLIHMMRSRDRASKIESVYECKKDKETQTIIISIPYWKWTIDTLSFWRTFFPTSFHLLLIPFCHTTHAFILTIQHSKLFSLTFVHHFVFHFNSLLLSSFSPAILIQFRDNHILSLCESHASFNLILHILVYDCLHSAGNGEPRGGHLWVTNERLIIHRDSSLLLSFQSIRITIKVGNG